MAVAEFLRAVFEEADQRPVDVAEAEEAEVVGADGSLLARAAGARQGVRAADAALFRRDSRRRRLAPSPGRLCATWLYARSDDRTIPSPWCVRA